MHESRGNRRLLTPEVEALRADDFLLGRTAPGPVGDAALQDLGAGLHVEQTFAELDVALKCRDLVSAEAIWKRMRHRAKEGAAAILVERPELRPIASRYVTAMTPKVLDELETALDRGDRAAAALEHQRLDDLRSSWLSGAGPGNLGIGPRGVAGGDDVAIDVPGERARKAQLEARYQQLVHRRGPLVCGLLPDLWCSYLCPIAERSAITDLCSGESEVAQPVTHPAGGALGPLRAPPVGGGGRHPAAVNCAR